MKREYKKKHVEVEIAESLGNGNLTTSNKKLEKRIIACCFQRKPELALICSKMTPEVFSDPRYKVFFQYISKTFESGKLPDFDVCVAQSQRSTDYDIDPEDYHEGLQGALDGGSECDVEQVCNELYGLYISRRLMGHAARISANIADGNPTEELVAKAEESIRKLTGDIIREDTLKDIDQLIAGSPLGIGELLDPPMDGIQSPWPSLNDYIYGFRPGQMFTVGARPGAGKSAFLVQVAQHAANLGNIVCFFSLEMSSFDIWTRIVCERVGIKSSDIMHRQITKQERDRIESYIRNEAPRNLIISDRGGRTPLSMRAELARVKSKFGRVDMVCVDYVQLMESPTHAGSGRRVDEVGFVSKFLKKASMELNTRMVVAAQLNRQGDNRPGDERPKLSDFRESGSLEQDSDTCLLLHRPSLGNKKQKDGVPEPHDEYIVAKQRRGRTGILNMRYVGEYYKFVEAQ